MIFCFYLLFAVVTGFCAIIWYQRIISVFPAPIVKIYLNSMVSIDVLIENNDADSSDFITNFRYSDTMNATAFGADVVLPDPLPDVFDDANNADHDDGPTSPAPPGHELSYHDVVEEFLNNSLDNREDSISGHVYFERIK